MNSFTAYVIQGFVLALPLLALLYAVLHSPLGRRLRRQLRWSKSPKLLRPVFLQGEIQQERKRS